MLEFDANARLLYSANVWLRTASRIVVRAATFRATDFIHLQDHAAQVDWGRWIADGVAPRFRISSTDSKLYHTKAIAQRLHQVSLPPSIGEPEQLVIVRIDRNNVTLSIDSSGDALYKRPWRTDLGQAPLRTTMAAAMLAAARWDAATALVDPFCGCGTIGIEAALLAAGLPPGGERSFAFHHWPDFDPGSWASVAGSVGSAKTGVGANDRPAPIVMSDRDPEAVESVKANAERAGVADRIEVTTQVLSHIKGRSGPGLVATNPPYGKRIGRSDLRNLYGRLGSVTRDRLPGHAVALLTADPKLARAADGRLRSIARFRHGGLPVELFVRPAVDDATEAGRSTDRPAATTTSG
jgi:putative N6-adenine-specific DNA methylase